MARVLRSTPAFGRSEYLFADFTWFIPEAIRVNRSPCELALPNSPIKTLTEVFLIW